MNNPETYLLEMNGICKSFPGVKALDGVDLKIRPYSVHALVGENGAGKSTLMKCLFGIYEEDAGEVIFNGQRVHFQIQGKPWTMAYPWFTRSSIRFRIEA